MKRRFKIPYFHLIAASWHYAEKNRRRMVFFYFLTTLANIAAMGQPYVIGQFINHIQKGGPNLLHDAIFWFGLYVFLTFVFWSLHGPSRVIERKIAYHVRNNFVHKHYDMITHLPMQWHQNHHSGSTVNRVNKASNAIYRFSETQYNYLQGIVRVIVAFVMLSVISGKIALIEMAFVGCIAYIITRYDKVLIPMNHEINECEHRYNSMFFDSVTNIASVISFNLAKYTKNNLLGTLYSIEPVQKREVTLNEVKWFSIDMLVNIAQFIMIISYIHNMVTNSGSILIGNIVAVFQYLNNLNMVLFSFAGHYDQLVRHHTDLESSEPIEEAYQALSTNDEGKPDLQVNKGEITFDHINFAYQNGKKVFDVLHLDIKSGQKVGLVGRSGAGKTTLVNLLLRFYDTSDNQIRIDGQNIYNVTSHSLRENIAVIPQDTTLFQTTLMENIRFGKLGASDEEVIEAARKAHAHEFIVGLKDGYNSLVGERGIKLSGGQRQRIAIARAILKNAPILILDEATSALDSESEKLIQESFAGLMENKTVIAIAHRLSTISHLDRLIVLEDGHIVEDGKHTELLAKDGYYAKLWAMQSGGFLPD